MADQDPPEPDIPLDEGDLTLQLTEGDADLPSGPPISDKSTV